MTRLRIEHSPLPADVPSPLEAPLGLAVDYRDAEPPARPRGVSSPAALAAALEIAGAHGLPISAAKIAAAVSKARPAIRRRARRVLPTKGKRKRKVHVPLPRRPKVTAGT